MALSKVRGLLMSFRNISTYAKYFIVYNSNNDYFKEKKHIERDLICYFLNSWQEDEKNGNYSCNPKFYISIYVTTGSVK